MTYVHPYVANWAENHLLPFWWIYLHRWAKLSSLFIVLFSGCFGITREDWDAIKDQIPPMDMDVVRQKREQAFHESPGDAYAIYQLKRDDATVDLRFMNSEWLQKQGLDPQYENYELVYTGALPQEGSQIEKLEDLYRIFNVEHPQDFTGHSLSISDIVALPEAEQG